MKESDFHKEWRESWIHYYPDCHIVKVPDSIRSAESRFIPSKPYDFYLWYKGQFIAMELKIQNINRGLSFDRVSQWQEENLKQVYRQEGIGMLAINFRGDVDMKKESKTGWGRGRYNIVVCLGIFDWIDLCCATDKKSITAFDMPIYPYNLTTPYIVIDKKADGYWPVSDLILSLRKLKG